MWLDKGRQTAVDQYTKDLFPADGGCNLVVTLGAPKQAFRVLSEYFLARKVPFEAKTRPKWITLLEPLYLDPPIWQKTPLSGRMVSRSWSIAAKNCCKTM